MAHQFQVVSAAGVNVFNNEPQDLLADVSCVGNGSGSVPYSVNSGLVGAVENQPLFSISQPGTVIPLSAYQPQQLLLVGDGLQQQGLCTIAVAPGDGSLSQEAQFVSQPQVQQLVFEAQSSTDNGFFVNTVPLAGPSWVYANGKGPTIVPSTTSSLLQNLLQQPTNTVVPVLNQSNTPATKQILVMLPSGEQRYVKVETTPNEARSSNQMAGAILPTMNPNVEQMFAKQMTHEEIDIKQDVISKSLVPMVRDDLPICDQKEDIRPPSPSNDIIVLKEVKTPFRDPKRDPLEQLEQKKLPAPQGNGVYYVVASELNAVFGLNKNSAEESQLEAEDDELQESEEVPKYLEVMAVCTHCGYTSMDFNRCQRCKRKLPTEVRTVPVSKATPVEKQVVTFTNFQSPPLVKCHCGSQSLNHDWNRCVEKKVSKAAKPAPQPVGLKAAVIKKAALEHLDAMAVCSYCGYTSKDVDQCERCRRLLPENVKFVLSPKLPVPSKKISKR